MTRKSFPETAVVCTASYFVKKIMMFQLVLNCFICGRRKVAVARYRMICLVFTKKQNKPSYDGW